MNSKPIDSKRRAELQRKLALNAVPRPPADLAERIKADIPKYFDTEAERGRFSRNVAFNMRVAASVLLAITSLSAIVFFMQHSSVRKEASLSQPVVFAPAPRALQDAQSSTATTAEEVRLDIREEPEAPRLQVPRPIVNYHAPEAPRQIASNQLDDTDAARKENDTEAVPATEIAGGAPGGVMGGAVGGINGGVTGGRAMMLNTTAEFAPQVTGPAAAYDEPADAETKVADAQPAVAQPKTHNEALDTATSRAGSAAARERITVTAEAPMAMAPAAPAMRPAAAAPMAKRARDERRADHPEGTIFGISVDPEVFQDIRATLENGARPRVSAVDVEALVNYFAGAPAKRPRNVSLEVEASPAPIEAEGDHAILRFTIDTPAATNSAASAIAKDARIEIMLDTAAVERAHRIGANDPPARESELQSNTSVTGLYALELRPHLKATQVVATVRLHYIERGKARTLTHVVHGSDLARGWKDASRRHRLASLGAVWGETLRDMAPGLDVAKRAEELASQNPKDSRAKELAAAANASADGER